MTRKVAPGEFFTAADLKVDTREWQFWKLERMGWDALQRIDAYALGTSARVAKHFSDIANEADRAT